MGTGETDNCLENQLIPDLTVIDKYEQWNKDGTYNVYYTKQNIGNAPCGISITCVYIDSELEQSILNPGLQPGESMDGVFESLVCSPDSDNVTVCADCENDILEGDEDNNCLSNIWDCYHRPDLVISGWSLMVDDNDPTKYQLYFTVENIGSADAGDSTTKLMRDGVDYNTIATPALAAGESVTQKFSDIEKPTKALKICADSTSAVEESNEGNNCTPCGGLNIWGGPGSGGPHVYVDVRDGLGVVCLVQPIA
jgi:subtilase family serine protease